MDMNRKILIYILISVLVSGCTRDTYDTEAVLVSAIDTKPMADSLYEEWCKSNPNETFSHPREIQLNYMLTNHNNKRYYLPIKTFGNSGVYSYLDITLVCGADTITPAFYVRQNNNGYVEKGESLYIEVNLHRFEEWQSKGCNVETPIREIVPMIHIDYHKDIRDDTCKTAEIPETQFISDNPNAYYFFIPRGGHYGVYDY